MHGVGVEVEEYDPRDPRSTFLFARSPLPAVSLFFSVTPAGRRLGDGQVWQRALLAMVAQSVRRLRTQNAGPPNDLGLRNLNFNKAEEQSEREECDGRTAAARLQLHAYFCS